MLQHVSRKFPDVLRELDVPSGTSFKMNAIVQPFIQLSYNYAVRGDSRFAHGIRETCENCSIPRHFLTILVGFILFNSLRTIFGSCNKLTTGLTLDYIKFFLYYCGSIKYR